MARGAPLTLLRGAQNETLLKNCRPVPSGAGFDVGVTISLVDPTPLRIDLITSFHHMNEDGFYVSWTEHMINITPSLLYEINISISGPDRNDVKDYIHDVIYNALVAEFAEFEE